MKSIELKIPSGYITVSEASEMLDILPGTVRGYLSSKVFTTHKIGTMTLLSRHEVEEYKEKRQ